MIPLAQNRRVVESTDIAVGYRETRAPDGQPCSTNGRRRVRVVQCSSIPMIGREEQQHAANPWPSGARVLRYPTAGSHHSYGVDSITRRFRADGIMKVFFNDCQASNQYGLTTQRSDRGDRELRDAKKSGKCPHAGLHCSPRHTGIVCLCVPRLWY